MLYDLKPKGTKTLILMIGICISLGAVIIFFLSNINTEKGQEKKNKSLLIGTIFMPQKTNAKKIFRPRYIEIIQTDERAKVLSDNLGLVCKKGYSYNDFKGSVPHRNPDCVATFKTDIIVPINKEDK